MDRTEPTTFGFVSWDGSGHRRACPLATFGPLRETPLALTARLVCVDPPRAECAEIANAQDVAGAIALVVRGGCSFADKARRVQAAGAVAMVLANNTREEPDAAFTMAEDALPLGAALPLPAITIPCVMMCLLDVRELFQKFPPTTSSGVLMIEVLRHQEAVVATAESLRIRQEMKQAFEEQQQRRNGGGWGVGNVLKRKTTALIKLMEPQPAQTNARQTPCENAGMQNTRSTSEEQERPTEVSQLLASSGRQLPAIATETPITAVLPAENPAPLVAFVQWATSADAYHVDYAPLADFCHVRGGAVFDSRLVVCDPVLANTDQLANAAALYGSIALIKRGVCTFPAKLERVQACGAIAAIVGNDDLSDPDAAFVMSVDSISTDHITIPAVMVSSTTFQRLIADRVARIRVLCVAAGLAAADLLARTGSESSISQADRNADILCAYVRKGGSGSSRNRDSIDNGEALEDLDSGEALEELDNDVRAFHAICRAGDYESCIHHIERTCGDDEDMTKKLISTRDSTWRCSLHYACIGGNERIVELLLQRGASPFDIDLAAQTALHVASAHTHAPCVELLLQAASSWNQTDEVDDGRMRLLTADIGGSTPIHLATVAGSAATLELLLTANAQVTEDGTYKFDGVNERDVDGATPLHLACRHERSDCAVYLLAASADANAIDSSGSSPLAISCEMLNEREDDNTSDLLFIIEKLLSAGATMDQALTREVAEMEPCGSNDDSTGREVPGKSPAANEMLLLDRIDSPLVKRDVEILYLRHEVQSLRSTLRAARNEKHILSTRVDLLDRSIAQFQQRESAHQSTCEEQNTSFTRQIDQLQSQMGTLLQLLRINSDTSRLIGGDFSDPSLIGIASDSLFKISTGSEEGYKRVATIPSAHDGANGDDKMLGHHLAQASSDQSAASQHELALDAGLSRDIGKKLLRRRQFDLAEAYFARSLEILPLPGVAELRNKCRAAQQESSGPSKEQSARATTTIVAPSESNCSTLFADNDSVSSTIKEATVHRLIAAVVASGAPENVRMSLEREVSKLTAIPGGSNEFELTCKWLQWLVTLPWGDPASGLASSVSGWKPWSRAGSTINAFLELEKIEQDDESCRKDRAARRIQQAMRDWASCRASAANLIDAAAVIRIQRGFRRWQLQRLTSANCEQSRSKPDDKSNDHELEMHSPRNQKMHECEDGFIDYSVDVDRAALRKLPKICTISVEAGVKICAKEDRHQFRIVQILCTQSNPRLAKTAGERVNGEALLPSSDYSSLLKLTRHYVWTRWRHEGDAHVQGVLSGPYEDLDAATRRYERLLANECANFQRQAAPGSRDRSTDAISSSKASIAIRTPQHLSALSA